MRLKKVLFTDIDGTLIDIFTRKYGKSTKRLIEKLKSHSIPVVLCSSKTWAEQDVMRKDLGLEGEPFIVENGGGVMIPDGYFSVGLHRGKKTNGYTVIEFGKSSAEIRKALQDIRRKTHIAFTGVSDIYVEELAKIVGMSLGEAERMSKRQYGETILDIDKNKKAQFEQALAEQGLQLIHGGRYFDVTAGNDKGEAVRLLIDLYREKLGNDAIFIGIGDSPNDLPMLKVTDIPLLVQKQNGSWAVLDMSGIRKVDGIGPAGWDKAIEDIVMNVETDSA